MTDHFLNEFLLEFGKFFNISSSMSALSNSSYNLIVILGPTASGKTSLGVSLAQKLNGEILSADSRQVYVGLDLGSGKDLHEYQNIPYHLIDIVEPGIEYSVFHFQKDFFQAFEDIKSRNNTPIMVGGTGLYIDAIVQNYQLTEVPVNKTLRDELKQLEIPQLQEKLLQLKPQQHNETDLNNRTRLVRAIEIATAEQSEHSSISAPLDYPQIKPIILGIKWPRAVLRQRITQRLKQRLEEGLIEEVQNLLAQGVSYETLQFYGLEYRLVSQHVQGELSYNDMFQKLNSQIHQFAKRQDTWFRKMERRGDQIHWLDPETDLDPNLVEQAITCLKKFSH